MPRNDQTPARSKADYQMEWLGSDNLSFSDFLSRPYADPATSASSRRLELDKPFEFLFGTVVFSMAYAHCYKVIVDKSKEIIWCAAGTDTGLQPFGAKQLNTIPEGSTVVVFRHPNIKGWGFILCVIPSFITNAANGRSDQISQSSRCGPPVDFLYQYILQMKRSGGVINFSSGRPTDSLPVGEAGWMTETGLGIFIDSFMAYLRVNEANGLFVFNDGPLVRLAGTNFQFRTPGEEWEWLNDQNEVNKFGGKTPYFWEALGIMNYGTAGHRSYTALQSQIQTPQFSKYEPLHDDQQPFHRIQEFDGYLGQGGRRQVILPASSETGATVNRYVSTPNRIGVFDENVSLTGRYMLTSAKGIHIGKRAAIPVPKLRKRPEDANGDNESNYKFASMFGSGPSHVVKDVATNAAESEFVGATALSDLHAYIHNREKQTPFHYHANDYYLPEEGEQAPIAKVQATPVFSSLATNYILPPPAPKAITVDHRYGSVYYWETMSYIDLLDSGAVVAGDGSGCEIKMIDGIIYLSSPADVVVQSGRDFVVMAGRDVILKAKDNVDVSASTKNVTVKAEEHLMMLGGNENNEKGGVLIENKSPCSKYDFTQLGSDAVSSGIILKSEKARVVIDAAHVVVNSRGLDAVDPAIYLLSAGGRIKTKADYHERFSTNANIDVFLNSSGQVTNTNEWWSDSSTIGTPVRIKGRLELNGSMLLSGWLSIIDGHIASAKANDWECKILKLSNTQKAAQEQLRDMLDSRVTALSSVSAVEAADVNFDVNEQKWRKAQFSFRIPSQYRNTGFMLYETRWQRVARLTGDVGLVTWAERAVNAKNAAGATVDTYPYPGKDMLLGQTFKTVNATMFNDVDGVSEDRGTAPYTSAALGTPQTNILNSSYKVVG